jgi:hypothetical protein
MDMHKTVEANLISAIPVPSDCAAIQCMAIPLLIGLIFCITPGVNWLPISHPMNRL